MPQRLSIIIPTLNESSCIDALLSDLQPFRNAGHEVILVDGGSDDGTPQQALGLVDRTLTSALGRSTQMNAGASLAAGHVLWFLHADCRVSASSATALLETTRASDTWGRFDVRLSGHDIRLRVVEQLMNWRSRLTGISTGDQGIFVDRALFDLVGGFPDIPLMEDIALSKLLRRHSKPVCIDQPKLQTSSRRWESNGVFRTIFLMWRLRLAYSLGTPAQVLAKRYR